MIRIIFGLFFLYLFISSAYANPFGPPTLEIVAQLKERPGNVAVHARGRVFISLHPFGNPVYKVMEVAPDGTTKPFPNDKWSRDPGPDGMGLSNVIHLKILGDVLYILDMGAEKSTPKLMAWDIIGNTLKRVWYIPENAVTAQSFLQDFVITPDGRHVFIADMGQADLIGQPDPAIIHLNLDTGMAMRKLTGHPSLRPPQKQMMAGGKSIMLTRGGKEHPLLLGLNPITMDPRGTTLYYAPMSQGLIYRIPVADLMKPDLPAGDLAKKVTIFGAKPSSDGMIVDHAENIFIGSQNDGSIGIVNNKGKYTTWIRDAMLSWVDGMAFGPDNAVYATVNQLHLSGVFNKGEEKSIPPYLVVRVVGGRPVMPPATPNQQKPNPAE